MRKLDNNAVVGMSVNLIYNAIDFAGPEALKLEVNNIKPPCLCQAHRMVSASCQQSSVTKWRIYTVLNSMQSSLSLPRNKHMRPSLKAPFKVCTPRFWAASFSRWCCRWQLLRFCFNGRKQETNRDLQVAFVMSCSRTNQLLAQLDAQCSRTCVVTSSAWQSHASVCQHT